MMKYLFVLFAAAWVVLPAQAQRQPEDAVQPAFAPYTRADVAFMQGMIHHHAQAVQMSALVSSRTNRRALHLIAERIDVSQRDEIAYMRSWLSERGQDIPDVSYAPPAAGDHTVDPDVDHDPGHGQRPQRSAAHNEDVPGVHGVHDVRMPGMLSPDEMKRLAETKGATFERLFLQSMIFHHEGALTMVEDLLGSDGAAQAPEVFRFASDIDADQRAEIRRMRALLDSPD